jgi:hypothetical protein
MGNGSIPFTGAMIRAAHAGRKRHTRRLASPQPRDGRLVCADIPGHPTGGYLIDAAELTTRGQPKPPYLPGETLWVKETWHLPKHFDGYGGVDAGELFKAAGGTLQGIPIMYAADGARSPGWAEGLPPGRPRINRYMPRWASRLTVQVGATRWERLQAITEADAMAEGAIAIGGGFCFDLGAAGEPLLGALTARLAYKKLWDSIHGGQESGWSADPWVLVVELEAFKKTTDLI